MVSVATSLPQAVSGWEDLESWLSGLVPHYPPQHLDQIRRAALSVAQQLMGPDASKHLRTQLATVDILAQLRLDVPTLIAALYWNLPPGVQPLVPHEIAADFQALRTDLNRMAALPAYVPRLGDKRQEREQAEAHRRLLLGIPRDVRPLLVWLARRLQTLREAKTLPREAQKPLATETLEILAPLANRLGLWQLKWELEDLGLRYLEPDEYKRIAKFLDERREDRQRFIRDTILHLETTLAAAGVAAQVTGRPKHIYSIWRKMRRKQVDFEQIFDVRAVRILVNDVADCYAALGVVHGLWPPIAKEFDDYIAHPKANLYQSLHTAVIDTDDRPLEIQIRTHDMHRHAELGVAAHWVYKENAGHDADFERRVSWMRQWFKRCIDGLPEEVAPVPPADQIFVLTPQGKVIELPRAATAVDFAYAIHTEVGHRCRGARANGRIIPLDQSLESGQTVEILTAKQPGPSRDWLSPHHGYIKTARARTRVRHWFRLLDFDLHVAQGRAALERELGRLTVTERPELGELTQRFRFQRHEDLLAAIGCGELSAIQVAGTGVVTPSALSQTPPKKTLSARAGHGSLVIAGIGDLMSQMAGCCKPVPYDAIDGYLTRGRGVTVHRADCANLVHLRALEIERSIEVAWASQPPQAVYRVDLDVRIGDRKALLRDISSVFANEDINVVAVNTLPARHKGSAILRFTIEIGNTAQLARTRAKITQIPDVFQVYRRA
ncbi:MAG: bifunctional (p)ppGpp synthetase/guanosine-3',5'-bis(diphosphate) 3'-pyrophosphohydrolase [Pseudomonadota bacterium]